MTILTTSEIVIELAAGNIICTPAPTKIEGTHIDVTLGPWWWRFEPLRDAMNQPKILVLDEADPLEWFSLGYGVHEFGKQRSEADVERIYREVQEQAERPRYLHVPAHSFMLMHTNEAIGVRHDSRLTCDLDTRSTEARWAQETQTGGAGKGDPGYATFWTVEQRHVIPVDVLKRVGSRIGSITFTRTSGTPVAYEHRYNTTPDQWTPLSMLPRRANW